ncbi:hypothetical protein H4R34_000795 [Dimargaris verticillata]|uniref:SANTA domain-containing protein n=1 Tax=Dimargaris verticillata TaxID=2761393 RepID=A0A9W8EAY1_9FUNG|nr:hypothetical protein H4R34_000795 [Dimargaris verticillata]
MACPPNAPDANDVRVSTKALFRIRDPSVLRSPVPRLPIASNANRASSQAISRTSAVMLSQSVTPNATALTPLTNNSWLSGHSARPSAFATPSTVLQAPTTGFGQPTSRLLTPQNGQTPVDHIVTWSTLSKAQDNPPFTRGQPSAAPLIRPTAHTPCLGQVLEPLPISAHTVSTKPRSRTPVAPLSASTHLAHESSKQRSVIRSYPTPQSEKSALAPCRPLTSLLTQSVQPKASRPLLDCRRSVDPLLWSSQPTAAQNASARLADIAETYGHFDVCLAKWWIRVDTANALPGFGTAMGMGMGMGILAQTWKSSFVADRLAANKVRTINGKVYLLDGECNIARMQTFGYSARKIKLFLNGFPTNWQDILPPDAGKDQLALAPVHLPVTRSQTPQASPVVHAQAKRSELVPRADDLTLSAMAFAETTASKFALPSEPRGRSVLSETSSLVQSGGSPGDSCTHTPVPNDYSPPADLPSQSTALPKALKPPPKSAPAPRRSRRISQRTRRSLATSPLLPAKPRSERSTHSSLPANATPSPAPVLKFVWGQSEPVIQVAGRYVPFSCYAAQDKSPSMVTRGKRKRQVLLSGKSLDFQRHG